MVFWEGVQKFRACRTNGVTESSPSRIRGTNAHMHKGRQRRRLLRFGGGGGGGAISRLCLAALCPKGG